MVKTAEMVIVGTGSLAAGVANALSQSRIRMRVAVIGRSIAKTSQLVKIGNARAAMFGAPTRFEGVEIRRFQAAAFARAFRELKPRVIFQTASLQSPWEAGEGENGWTKLVASAGFGITLPLQMGLAAEVSRGAEGGEAAIVNASYPDGVNVAMERLNLRITCGIGNAAIVEAFCRAVAGGNGDVQVVGHHGHFGAWVRGNRVGRKPRVWVKGREVQGLRYSPKVTAVDEELNQVTATTAVVVLMSLLTGQTLRISIPGVEGLPGGYPFELRKGKLKLELPAGITKEEAVAHNRTGERQDGVELGEGVRFTERARSELASVGFEYAEGFAFGEWEAVRDRMLVIRERLRRKEKS
jgi:hypothetical protein